MLPIIAGLAAMGLAGTAIQAGGLFSAANAEEDAARESADMVRMNTQFRIDDIERDRLNRMAAQRASYGARGVRLSGSPLEVLAETNELANIEKQRVRIAGNFQATQILKQGANRAKQYRGSAIGGILSGTASTLGSAFLAYSRTSGSE